MLRAYRVYDRRLQGENVEQPERLSADAVWVDLVRPTAIEMAWVENCYAQHLPGLAAIVEIEASSRVFEDEEGLHLRAFFLERRADRAANVTVGFLLTPKRLFTIREDELRSFEEFSHKAEKTPDFAADGTAVLLGIFEYQLDGTADILEALYARLERKGLFDSGGEELGRLVSEIAAVEDANGKARLSLMDAQRVLAFFERSWVLSPEHRQRLKDAWRDVESLISHSNFLSEKVNFLADITLGRINVEQNRVIKILSVAATVFLPPTLVASIYGMNFRHMPELASPWGYPLALVLILLSGALPYWFFKRRGWL